MKEAETSQIDVEDVDTKTMKQVVKFIYCGKLPDELRFNVSELTIQKKREAQEVAMAILAVAERYGILALKETCSGLIAATLSKENIVDTLVLSNFYRISDLKRLCFQRLTDWKASFERGAFDELKAHPGLLLEAMEYWACEPDTSCSSTSLSSNTDY